METVSNRVALKEGKLPPYPKGEERQRAVNSVIKYVQHKFFPRELAYFASPGMGRVKKGLARSPLHALSPFVGRDGVLRIGGRLGDRVDSPHPIIPPGTSA